MFNLDQFKNFFKYYEDLPHQQEAIRELFEDMNPSLLTDEAVWVKKYRQSNSATELDTHTAWPITKEQLGRIMLCSADALPDSLMTDLAKCVDLYKMSTTSLAYFLGQCGHESAGLRYPVEIHSGSNYEFRSDLGNVAAGDGVKYAGTGYIQVTGRANHQDFSNYLTRHGKPDSRVMDIGKTYSSEVYPWSISGFWWLNAGMNEYCQHMPNVDEVGARVNGKYLPNGFHERREYTSRAFSVLGI